MASEHGVQVTHERPEWAYAVYVMGPDGCEFSKRFEYDKDKPHTIGAARADALSCYRRKLAEYPRADGYIDL